MDVMDAFWAAPPIVRTITAAAVIESVLVYSGLLSIHRVIFISGLILKTFPPEIWRLITPFLLTAPKLGMVFDPYFLFTYGKALEAESPRFSGTSDFFIYVAFLGTMILGLNGLILGSYTFIDALILSFAYTFSQDNSRSQVGFILFRIPAVLLPYAILAFTFMMQGPDSAKAQATGLLAAHLYDFLTRIWPTFGGGSNWLQTPAFVKSLFGEDARNVNRKSYGTSFSASTSQSSANSSGWSSSFTRGGGRRLGGD